MGDERDELAARLVDGLERLDPGLRLGLLAALLDDAREQVGDGAELGDVGVAEPARPLGLDVEHADDLVVPGQRHAEHRGDEPALVDAADPQEARVGLDVGDDQRTLGRRDVAGDALAERHARPADLEAVEAVRRGERQVRSVPVEQVERGDIGMERIARPVDDGLQQLVPGPRGRREPRDLVEEAQLGQLVAGRAPSGLAIGRSRARSVGGASSSPYKGRKGCGRRRLRRRPA